MKTPPETRQHFTSPILAQKRGDPLFHMSPSSTEYVRAVWYSLTSVANLIAILYRRSIMIVGVTSKYIASLKQAGGFLKYSRVNRFQVQEVNHCKVLEHYSLEAKK